VIADQAPTVANEDGSVKIMQTEEAWEEKSTGPERIRNPAVQVMIIPRRRVVRDNRGPFFIIIVGYGLRAHLRLAFSIRTGVSRQYG
jgi:hypothetical protein